MPKEEKKSLLFFSRYKIAVLAWREECMYGIYMRKVRKIHLGSIHNNRALSKKRVREREEKGPAQRKSPTVTINNTLSFSLSLCERERCISYLVISTLWAHTHTHSLQPCEHHTHTKGQPPVSWPSISGLRRRQNILLLLVLLFYFQPHFLSERSQSNTVALRERKNWRQLNVSFIFKESI